MNRITYDIETTGYDAWGDRIAMFGYKYNNNPTVVCYDHIPDEALEMLADPKVRNEAHGKSFDDKFLCVAGVEIDGEHYDSRIAYKYKYPFRPAGLKDILKRDFNEEVTSFNEMVETHRPRIPKGQKMTREERRELNAKYAAMQWPEFVPREVSSAYLIQDVEGCRKVVDTLGPPGPWLKNVEFPLIDVVRRMEMRGIYIDQKAVTALHDELVDEIQHIEEQFPVFNKTKTKTQSILTSPKELRTYLAVELGLSRDLSKYLTQSGEYSTNKEAMEMLAQRIPVARTILRYREISKLVSSYTSKMKGKDIIRGQFNQFGTKTGRFSSSKPNLQQVPARTATGMKVRRCFRARPGHKLVVADLSQIEPRYYAFASRDPILMKVFQEGGDFHGTVTKAIYKRNTFTKEERFIGKTVGLAVLYGARPKTVQKFLNKVGVHLTIAECAKIRQSILEGFPTAARWSESQWTWWKAKGRIVTLGGRVINKEEYKVNPVNYKVQPSCADIMKIILLNIDRTGYPINCTVHDEVMVEVPTEQAEAVAKEVKWCMENSVILKGVPLSTDVKIVDSWDEAK